jgi:hypothetical protein
MQLHKVDGGPQGRTSWADFQGQDKLTRPSWNVQFKKEKDRQVVRFNEKLIRGQPITNMEYLDLNQLIPGIMDFSHSLA